MGEGREGALPGEWGQSWSVYTNHTLPYPPTPNHTLRGQSRRLLRPHSIVPSHGIVCYMVSPSLTLIPRYCMVAASLSTHCVIC